jgi:hypothetical protein
LIGFDDLIEGWKHFVKVPDDAIIGLLEDRGGFVFVNGDNDFGLVDPNHVLDLSGYADGDVDFGLKHGPGYADISFSGHPVDAFGDGTGTPDFSTD